MEITPTSEATMPATMTLTTQVWNSREYFSAECTCCSYRSNFDTDLAKVERLATAHAKKCAK